MPLDNKKETHIYDAKRIFIGWQTTEQPCNQWPRLYCFIGERIEVIEQLPDYIAKCDVPGGQGRHYGDNTNCLEFILSPLSSQTLLVD